MVFVDKKVIGNLKVPLCAGLRVLLLTGFT
jgi:hypothetical protein